MREYLPRLTVIQLGKYNKKARIRAQKLENLMMAVKFLKEEQVKLVSVGPEGVTHSLSDPFKSGSRRQLVGPCGIL
jgi:hypothetical protein